MKGKFTIAEPCHEDWNKMTADEKGKFCDVCSKCVFDLTKKSQPEILEIYQQNKGNVCGRVTSSQLAETIASNTPRFKTSGSGQKKEVGQLLSQMANSNGMRRLRIFAAACMMAFGFLFSGQAKAQGQIKMGKMAYHEEGGIRGKVFDEEGKALPEIEVTLYGENEEIRKTKTDQNGNYSFNQLPFGIYSVSAWKGPLKANQSGISIERNGSINIDLTLEEMFMLGAMMYIPDKQPDLQVIEVVETQGIDQDVKLGIISIENDLLVSEFTEEGTEDKPISAESNFKYLNEGLSPEIGITVYPNPTTGKSFISIKLHEDSDLNLSLRSVTGQVLTTKKIEKGAQVLHSIDLSGYPAGIYLLKVVAGNQVFEKKLVKLTL